MRRRPTGGRPASAAFVLFTVALDALCFGIVIPVLPDLVREVSHAPPSQASFYVGALFAVFSLTQFVCAPILGGLSDRFGRRPILLASLTALGINSLLWVWVNDLGWLFVMRVFAGLFAANVPTAAAYIGDVTPPEQRARYFGLIGAMFGLGFILGPVIGGILGEYWIRLPFLVSAGLIFCNVLYGTFVLPESLPPERRREFDWRRANPLASLLRLGFDATSLRLGFAWFATWFALGAQQTSFILSNQMRFGWNTLDNGLALAVGGVAQAVVQGLLVRRVIDRIGARETAIAGTLFAAAGYLVYSFAASPWMMVSGIPILALGALSGPPVQSLLSDAAGPQKQGEIQGALSSLQGLAMVLGPLVMGTLFAAATRPQGPVHVPGAPFMLAACACLAAALGLRHVLVPPAGETREPARAGSA
nr:TCR/Tet family MFS transporter [uncultured Lichenicoccus sp.]